MYGEKKIKELKSRLECEAVTIRRLLPRVREPEISGVSSHRRVVAMDWDGRGAGLAHCGTDGNSSVRRGFRSHRPEGEGLYPGGHGWELVRAEGFRLAAGGGRRL